jgi:hypothetical protein
MIVQVDDRVKFPQAPALWNRDRVYRVADVYPGGVVVECDGNTYRLTSDDIDRMEMTAAE